MQVTIIDHVYLATLYDNPRQRTFKLYATLNVEGKGVYHLQTCDKKTPVIKFDIIRSELLDQLEDSTYALSEVCNEMPEDLLSFDEFLRGSTYIWEAEYDNGFAEQPTTVGYYYTQRKARESLRRYADRGFGYPGDHAGVVRLLVVA